MIQFQARRSREHVAPSGALLYNHAPSTILHCPFSLSQRHSVNAAHVSNKQMQKKIISRSIPPISRHLLLPMGSNDDWVKLGFQMASNSPNHTAQHTCKAELAAWHVVCFVPILVGNGQAHATIQCGHCPPPEAENCNPQNTAEHALGEVM